MPYKEYALRAPTIQDAIDSAKAALQDAGLDPYELNLLREDEDGNDELGRIVDVVEPGRWHTEDPEWDYTTAPPTKISEGVVGNYALVNVRTRNAELQAFIDQLTPKDPKKQPSEIPPEEKIGTGLHRIDETQISSPERVWATV